MEKTQNQSHKFIIITLVVTIIIDVMGMGLVFPIFPKLFLSTAHVLLPVGTDIHTRQLFYGISMAMWPLGIFLGPPFLGKLSDKIGRKVVIVLCLGMTSVIYIATLFVINSHSLPLFILTRLLAGIFAGNFAIVQAVMMDISSEEEKTKNIGWITLAASIGIVVGPLITTLTAGVFHFSTPFLIYGILSLINTLSILLFLQDTYQGDRTVVLKFVDVFRSFSDIFLDKRTQFLAVMFLLFQFGWGLFIQGMPLMVAQYYKLNVSYIGLLFSVLGFGFMLTQIFLRDFLDKRFEEKKIILFAIYGLTVMLFLMFFIRSLSLVWVFVFIMAILELLFYTINLAQFSRLVSDAEQGKVMGGTGAIFGAAWTLNALFLSSFMKIGPLFPILVTAISILISAIMLTYFFKHKHKFIGKSAIDDNVQTHL